MIATADQVVKAWIVANYQVGQVVSIVGDFIRIAPSQNSGALFGLFRDQAPIFALLSLGVIGLIVWYESRAGASLFVTIALGLLLGGAIGNLGDRLRLGYVVDFVDMGIGAWRWYTFNVADASISTAVLLLLADGRPPGAGGGPAEWLTRLPSSTSSSSRRGRPQPGRSRRRGPQRACRAATSRS